MIPKFRAWYVLAEEMIDVRVIDWNNMIVDSFSPYIEIPLEKVILMQSTGLKDKNGKEIFEGDVLEIQDIKMIVRFGSYNYIETSKSGNHTLGIMCDGLGFYVECLNVAAPDKISPFEPETLKESVVIGNIYESQELLEVKE